MLFNSLDYVLFLAIVFVGFWALRTSRAGRVGLLLVASYAFYMSWNAKLIGLVAFSTLVDFGVGLALGRTESRGARKGLLLLSLFVNLGMLCVFKYGDFALVATTQIAGLMGRDMRFEPMNLLLPVGISFYTFQTLSYTIDVYRRRIPPALNLAEFATYVAFFPQLIAGPIVRASELLPQLAVEPRLRRAEVSEGLFLLLSGFIKKVLVADYLAANLIDRIFETPESYSSGEVWVAVYAYSFQIYGDFSGYTDLARGSAKLFGLELPENFRRPFMATGPIDFWKRWHITLSTWIQDYLYVPLGGSRKGEVRTYANLFFSFFLIGVWHGAGWTFVLFGLWHATGVTLNRVYRKWLEWRGIDREAREEAAPWRRWVAILVAFHFFVLQWPIFRSPNVDRMFEIYERMYAGDWATLRVPAGVWFVTLMMAAIHISPRGWVRRGLERFCALPMPVQAGAAAAVGALAMYVSSGQAATFIYFQF